MATKKAIIMKGLDVLIPITRGEVILDSKGEEAFHSFEFVASKTKPGLFTPKEKNIVDLAVTIPKDIPDDKIVLILKIDELNNTIDVFPKTKAEAVIVSVNNTTTTLSNVINLVLDLDDYPTQGSTKAVTSGGVWQHIDDTVGEIHRNVIKI